MNTEAPQEENPKPAEELQDEFSRLGWDLEEERREEEIFELREPFEKILAQLREDIEQHNISALIGDDTSGRVPTRILENILRRLYQKANIKTPTTLFINGPGGGKPHDEAEEEKRVDQVVAHLQQYVDAGELKVEPHNKILYVTEAINTGRSLEPVLRACKRLGFLVEVVSIGVEKVIGVRHLREDLGVRVYTGMEGTPKIYRKKAYSGVVKPGPSSAFPENKIPPEWRGFMSRSPWSK